MQPDAGTVQLVGAGPGPADLLTIRALRAIEGAEALLYDALVCPEVIALAPARCLRIQTGKRAGKTSMSQNAINRLMLYRQGPRPRERRVFERVAEAMVWLRGEDAAGEAA